MAFKLNQKVVAICSTKTLTKDAIYTVSEIATTAEYFMGCCLSCNGGTDIVGIAENPNSMYCICCFRPLEYTSCHGSKEVASQFSPADERIETPIRETKKLKQDA